LFGALDGGVRWCEGGGVIHVDFGSPEVSVSVHVVKFIEERPECVPNISCAGVSKRTDQTALEESDGLSVAENIKFIPDQNEFVV
jgi:hypothetical protein